MSVHLSQVPLANSYHDELHPYHDEVHPSRRASQLPANAWAPTESPADCSEEDSGVWLLAELLASEEPPRRPAGQELYERFSPLVERIARKMARSLPRTFSLEDLVSAGWVGMTEAHNRRPTDIPDDQFEAYASYRIRGAILDYLRSMDPLSRRQRSMSRAISHATARLASQLGRPASDEEIAGQLGVPLQRFQSYQAHFPTGGVERFDELWCREKPCERSSPEALAISLRMSETVQKCARELPERLQLILTLHYQQDASLREIGVALGVTESRVCQLHAQALHKLRALLSERRSASPSRTAQPSAIGQK